MKAFNSQMVCYIVMYVTLTLRVLRLVVGPTILHKLDHKILMSLSLFRSLLNLNE